MNIWKEVQRAGRESLGLTIAWAYHPPGVAILLESVDGLSN